MCEQDNTESITHRNAQTISFSASRFHNCYYTHLSSSPLSSRVVSHIFPQVMCSHGNGNWILRFLQNYNKQSQNLVIIFIQFHHILALNEARWGRALQITWCAVCGQEILPRTYQICGQGSTRAFHSSPLQHTHQTNWIAWRDSNTSEYSPLVLELSPST